MAVTPSYSGNRAVLDLAGRISAVAARLQPPGWNAAASPGSERVAFTGFSPMSADFMPQAGDPLTEWAVALWRRQAEPRTGTAMLLDHDLQTTRRIAWTDGLPLQLALSTLDAGSKQTFLATLQWQPATVDYPKPSGERVPVGTTKASRRLLCSNFRLTGLPFDARTVSRVTLPTATARVSSDSTGPQRTPVRRVATVVLGELAIELGARDRDAALAWVRQTMADGQVGDTERLILAAELLDPSLKTVAARVRLGGCALVGAQESQFGSGETIEALTLRFIVGTVDVDFAA